MEYHILGKICYKTSNNKWISGVEIILEASILKNKFSYQVENQDYFSNTNIGKKNNKANENKTKNCSAMSFKRGKWHEFYTLCIGVIYIWM